MDFFSYLQNENTPAHDYFFAKLCEVDVKQLTRNDLLTNNVIDLDANYLQIHDNDYDSLIGERAGIRKLSKDLSIKNVCNEFINKRDEIQSLVKFMLAYYKKVTHNKWVELNYE